MAGIFRAAIQEALKTERFDRYGSWKFMDFWQADHEHARDGIPARVSQIGTI